MADPPSTDVGAQGAPDPDMSRDLPSGMFRSGTEIKRTTISMYRRIQGLINVEAQYTEVNGNAIFEGDIVLGTVREIAEANATADTRGIGIVGEEFRWRDGVIPYVVAAAGLRPRVEGAIAHWRANTPIRLVERVEGQHPDYVSFEERDGCWSRVGRQGGVQVISLGAGCGLGSAIHEIGHTLGLWHEQSRSDRDEFITVVWDNIDTRFEHNFDKHTQDAEDLGGYDYGSIMHYPEKAFSVNGKPTIVAKSGQSIGQRSGLSPGDIAAIKMMYPKLAWS
jgi:hypothetical protein